MDPCDDSPLYQYIADTIESLLPKALEYGIPGSAELDIASIPDRIRAELNMIGYVALIAPMVCAWCKKPRKNPDLGREEMTADRSRETYRQDVMLLALQLDSPGSSRLGKVV